MYVWSSESNGSHPVSEDSNYAALDGTNGVLVMDSHDTNEAHSATLLFTGPNAQANAAKWHEWIATLDEEQQDDVNCGIDIRDHITACFQ